ncbi:ubiquitin-conjugating enzyme E2 variant [Silvibacterium dinghuense]|uniref:ubiquitin-conjugating enzyme E2 variant n=1 Tax=Silvibacterium dinghuense TaxID=1560006 RepID=UPI0013E99421|nr:ubiquitin-conjugating enzyme E2 [Silvibacterium dinghuense]
MYRPLPATAEPPAASLWATRLAGEWRLLAALAELNPERMTGLRQEDNTFHLTLRDVPALTRSGGIERTHALRIEFPEYFPAMPMELYLDRPMQHPNIHPDTGFMCLWDRHRATHTCEVALHKAVAILTWTLHNSAQVHVMQPAALASMKEKGDSVRAQLACTPLTGLTPPVMSPVTMPRRRRLS